MIDDSYYGKIIRFNGNNAHITMCFDFDRNEYGVHEDYYKYEQGSLFLVVGAKDKKHFANNDFKNKFYILKPLNNDATKANKNKELVWHVCFYIGNLNDDEQYFEIVE